MATLPVLGYPQGMTCYFNHHRIRIFDYAKFAQTYRDIIHKNAEYLAKSIGFKIHYISNHNTKTGEVVKAHLFKLKKKEQTVEGLFYIISCKELNTYYKPKF